MKLGNNKFKEVLSTFEVIRYTDTLYVSDEIGNIVEYDLTGNENHYESDVFYYDGEEYTLTDKQKDMINKLVVQHLNNYDSSSEPFTDEDYTHFKNIIYA
jgi:hypothetical protein